jgi:hypothetical protein
VTAPPPDRCRSCQAGIEWAKTDAGSVPMPVDWKNYAADDTRANVAVRRDDAGLLHARVLGKGEGILPSEQRTTSHFATCPNADQHRRRR